MAGDSDPNGAEGLLRRIGTGPDDGIDLAEAALALAALDPTDPAPDPALADCRRHLDRLVRYVATASGDDEDVAERCETLAAVIHEDFGYAGDMATYDDLQNANLVRVIERRKGLPIALGIVYMHAARHCGWTIHGLNFPGHFLLRLDGEVDRVILDPFHDGQMRDSGEMRGLLKSLQGAEAELVPEHYRRVSDREVLLRLQNNVKLRLMQLQQYEQAAAAVDRMLLFAPGVFTLWREAGLLHGHVGNLGSAIAALETYLDFETREAPRREVSSHLRQLRRRLN